MRGLIVATLGTGMRLGELLGLRRTDVCLSGQVPSVRVTRSTGHRLKQVQELQAEKRAAARRCRPAARPPWATESRAISTGGVKLCIGSAAEDSQHVGAGHPIEDLHDGIQIHRGVALCAVGEIVADGPQRRG
jgi:hypothetical protein